MGLDGKILGRSVPIETLEGSKFHEIVPFRGPKEDGVVQSECQCGTGGPLLRGVLDPRPPTHGHVTLLSGEEGFVGSRRPISPTSADPYSSHVVISVSLHSSLYSSFWKVCLVGVEV